MDKTCVIIIQMLTLYWGCSQRMANIVNFVPDINVATLDSAYNILGYAKFNKNRKFLPILC